MYSKGEGLFPVPLTVVSNLSPAEVFDTDLDEDVEEQEITPDLSFTDHVMFGAFQGQDNPFVSRVRVTRYFSVDESWKPDDRVTVIARFRDNSPAFLEHEYGRRRERLRHRLDGEKRVTANSTHSLREPMESLDTGGNPGQKKRRHPKKTLK